MRKKLLIIINPVSGTGQHESVVENITDLVKESEFDYKIVFTKHPGHATEMAAEAVKNQYDIVAAVGGDGTVHETGKALIGSSTALAIIPRGSGNGMANNLKIPLKLPSAIKVLTESKTIKIDTVKINDNCFLGIAGCGFDALVAWEFAKFGKRGLASYVKIVLREISKYKEDTYFLEIDGKEYTRKAFLISFANSSQFGNNAVVAPGAKMYDGLIDVAIIERFPINQLPQMAYKLFTNSLDKSKYLEIIKGKNIHIKQNSELVQLDGEGFSMGKELAISVNPLSLNIVVPGYKGKQNELTKTLFLGKKS
jgi:diacylglycerol kinase (ATP)